MTVSSSLLAAYTFGQFLAPYQSPSISGFREREPFVMAELAASAGFIGRSGYDGEDGPPSWGPQVFPKYWVDSGDGWAPSTLSIWRSLEALMAATFHGQHGDALSYRRDWQVLGDWPGYVLWWIPADHRPDWAEAVWRLEHLGDRGPTPDAFTFKIPFDAKGIRTQYDADKVKRLARDNAKAAAPRHTS